MNNAQYYIDSFVSSNKKECDVVYTLLQDYKKHFNDMKEAKNLLRLELLQSSYKTLIKRTFEDNNIHLNNIEIFHNGKTKLSLDLNHMNLIYEVCMEENNNYIKLKQINLFKKNEQNECLTYSIDENFITIEKGSDRYTEDTDAILKLYDKKNENNVALYNKNFDLHDKNNIKSLLQENKSLVLQFFLENKNIDAELDLLNIANDKNITIHPSLKKLQININDFHIQEKKLNKNKPCKNCG